MYRYFSETAQKHTLHFRPIRATNKYSALYTFIEKDAIDINQVIREIKGLSYNVTEKDVMEYFDWDITELEYKPGDELLEY